MVYPYDGRYERAGKLIWERGYYQSVRDRYLAAFKDAASGLRGPAPATLDDDQWWALGRHFGLVTPLLDWSELPYVAAYFALADLWSNITDNSKDGIIRYLERQSIAVFRLVHDRKLEGDGLRVVRPRVEELGRMQRQRGLFTWLDSERYFELQGFLDNNGRGDLLTQVLISEQAVEHGLRDLRAHGIEYRLLFPDLHGAALYANSKWDLI
jgi:hypothetical protein